LVDRSRERACFCTRLHGIDFNGCVGESTLTVEGRLFGAFDYETPFLLDFCTDYEPVEAFQSLKKWSFEKKRKKKNRV